MKQYLVQPQWEKLAINAVRAILVVWAIAAVLQGVGGIAA